MPTVLWTVVIPRTVAFCIAIALLCWVCLEFAENWQGPDDR